MTRWPISVNLTKNASQKRIARVTVHGTTMLNGVDGPARLLRFVTLVHWPFSVRSLDLFCGFTRIHEGHFVLC